MKGLSERGRRMGLIGVFLGAFSCLFFVLSISSPWLYDDVPVILNNPDIRSFVAFLENSYPGRPLRELTYLLDYSLFGFDSRWWHIQQLFWHGAGIALLFLLARRIGISVAGASVAALLQGVHPVTVEVVANLAHRKEMLALVFSLLSLHLFLSAVRRKGGALLWWGGSLLCFGLALAGKETVILLPVAVLFLLRLERDVSVQIRTRVLAVVSGLVSVAGIYGVTRLPDFASAKQELLVKMNLFAGWETAIYWQTVLKGWFLMVQNLFWPVNLAPEYVYPLPVGWGDVMVLAGGGFALLLIAALIWSVSRDRMLAFVLGWVVLLGLPTANLWPVAYFAADRYWYVPLAGISLGLGVLADRAMNRWSRRVVLIAGTVFLILLAGLTLRQQTWWQSSEALWARAVAVSPQSASARNSLSDALAQGGRYEEALREAERAVTINPHLTVGWYNAGALAGRLGRHEDAIRYLSRFLAMEDPAYVAQQFEVRRYLASRYGVFP